MLTISRRRFLVASAQAAAGWIVCPPLSCWGRTLKRKYPQKKIPLSFFHTHTEECLTIAHTPGRCSRTVQKKIKVFLRDFRTGDTHYIDPALLDILCRVQLAVGSRGIIEIISGYRSPQTNRELRLMSRGVAKKSLHMKGQAVDIRITDIPTAKIRDTAEALRTGGVGYYAASDFVHLDTGEYRTW